MKITALSLVHFKNHSDFQLVTNSDVVGIYGLNGKGKTNVLDAICFLCLGTSYFSGTDVQCIEHDQPVAGIRATIDDDEIKIKFKKGSTKVIEKNEIKRSRIDHLGHYFATVISPGDIELVYGDNKVRRRFVNQIICQTDEIYLKQLVKYSKLLENRNRHLKSHHVDESLLTTFDDQMEDLAVSIFEKRKQFFGSFRETYQEQYDKLSKHKEAVDLMYESQLEHYSFKEGSLANRQKDRALKRTNFGIHKDAIGLSLDSKLLKKFGSQGQIKSALISLKLGEYFYLRNVTKALPFLLLDDIFEKIDDERATQLTEIIKSGTFGQIFVTDTSKQRVEAFCKQIGKEFTLVELK